MQLAVCNVPFRDSIVWAKADMVVERITVDSVLYDSKIEDIKHFLHMEYFLKLWGNGTPENL